MDLEKPTRDRVPRPGMFRNHSEARAVFVSVLPPSGRRGPHPPMKLSITISLTPAERLALERALCPGSLLQRDVAEAWAERTLRWRIQGLIASRRADVNEEAEL